MKKILLLFLLVLFGLYAYSTPYEAEHQSRAVISSRLHDDIYVGSQTYKSLVGGLYEKDGVVGSVFYIDETTGTMLILCVTPHRLIGRNEFATYNLIKSRYQANGWNLLNRYVCPYLIANTPTMIYNRTWSDGDDLRFPIYDNILMETSDDAFYANIYVTCSPSRPYDTTWKWMWVTNEYGVDVKEDLGFAHTGWREVPLEPQYITHFIGG